MLGTHSITLRSSTIRNDRAESMATDDGVRRHFAERHKTNSAETSLVVESQTQ